MEKYDQMCAEALQRIFKKLDTDYELYKMKRMYEKTGMMIYPSASVTHHKGVAFASQAIMDAARWGKKAIEEAAGISKAMKADYDSRIQKEYQ